ncbi:MAG: DUF488 domain-containing protein [Actinomycetota bacterium]
MRKATIRTKRVYAPPAPDDGFRILVDRLWPRGLSKEKARVDIWMKETAPSNELRRWFGHDASRWQEFRKRYLAELQENSEAVTQFLEIINLENTVTLLFAAADEERNNAVVLEEYLNS